MNENKPVLDKTYDPGPIEGKWYSRWEAEGLFNADVDNTKEPFSIVIPPPNVTGSLHIGHAFNHTFQDIVCRYKRMKGFNVLWLPGTDHAGIATQNVVERKLAQQGLSRHDLGREDFVEKVWEWKEEYGNRIVEQQKKLGDSCDWRRLRFTMDEGLSKAVRSVFVRLYNKGLIYKGKYIINWCPRCHTALSDIEVDHEDLPGKLYYVRYPLIDGSGEIVVATTRPETILGDTAIAVHPRSEKNRGMIGQEVSVPLTDRSIKIIEDIMVDPEFGTGCVKITPAHDPNDFLVGLRHDLEQIQVIDENGFMNENAPLYTGMSALEARKVVVKHLEEKGFLIRTEDISHSVGHCYRCHTIIEPYLSEQWFVKTRPLADAGVKAVKDGKITWVPPQWENTYFQWMDNIRDWCISRQLWWGHRIPAWSCSDCGHITVAENDPTECSSCGSKNMVQDPDVLDTWFSSALWPFSTLGWPEKSQDLEYFYPTSLMVTGFDIIFFWVARMIMMGLEFMDDIEPFKDVYIHALVRDENGQKMSKSKGNVVDPLTLIGEFGADALRMTIAALTVQGRDILLGPKRVETYRFFMNKLWNASRFAIMNLEGFTNSGTLDPNCLRLHDKWIISRTNRVIQETTSLIDGYFIGEAARLLYDFTWGDICDWYLEMAKPALKGEEGIERKQVSQSVLHQVFRSVLMLLHPFIPFVTEELWNSFGFSKDFIERQDWPKATVDDIDNALEETVSSFQEVVRNIRNLRAEAHLPPQQRVPRLIIRTDDPDFTALLNRNDDMVSLLTRVDVLDVRSLSSEKPERSLSTVLAQGEIFLELGNLIDIASEVSRLDQELQALEKNISVNRKKLSNPAFVSKAPQEVVEQERERLRLGEERKQRILENIASLKDS